MRPPRLHAAVPWAIDLSLLACLSCLVLAISLGFAAQSAAHDRKARQLTIQADSLTRQIEGDLALFDLTLRESARLLTPRDSEPPPKIALLELPLTSHYIGFINILNEVGDVVADPRSNVSRPVNFAGRDYFQDHLKNAADVVMIGRPFATAPNQHASIPISRRLNRPDGSFAGVAVAGVRLTWLSDLLSRPASDPTPAVTIRREDGVILMREPFDADAIGRGGDADLAWQAWLRTGNSQTADDRDGVRLFRRVGASPLVIELTLAQAGIVDGPMPLLVALTLVPALCVICLAFLAHRLRRRGMRVEAAARAANDEPMRLLATMSHELRTPLTGILGQAELMTDEGGLTDHQMTRLTRLTEAGVLMRHIVDRVIDISAPDRIAETPIFTACDLDPLIRTCLGVVEGEARRKGVLLTSTVDPATPRRAMLDRDRVQQMLINLLMNAVKFTPRGTVSLRVTGHAAGLRFEVADTGPGIQPGKRRRLFRAYDRLDASASGVAGTGLGLSITERFVIRLGGRIGHRENPGGGSVFWIELPIAEAGVDMTASAPPAPLRTIRRLTVLLADDLDLTRAITAEFLRSDGHTVIETRDGETAIAEVGTRAFDAVVTDMRMPLVDGLEVARRIRAMPGHRGRTPIVLVTADLIALAAGQSSQTGVDFCVRKPFTRAELLIAVTTAAGLKPVPDAIAASSAVLDEVALLELRRSLGDEPFATHLEAAVHRIEDLHTMLDRSDAADDRVVRDAVHDLIGVAGLLGLAEFSACLRWFDMAADRTAPATLLHQATTAAVSALRRYPEPRRTVQ